MSTSTTTMPTKLGNAIPPSSVAGMGTTSVASLYWLDDASALVTVKGSREILMSWLKRFREVVTAEQNSFDATNVGPQT